uniref:Reverse transcriptase zinc-binding domain-containing protein n=1 Tax=Oryza nivara TaxID=4536 RepID=A0A0E0G6U4_ORYNI
MYLSPSSTVNGVFTVKSAYNYERRNCRTALASTTSSNEGGQKEWKKLWNLKCPNKMKHFLWLLAHNSLALRMRLSRKGMEIDIKEAVEGSEYGRNSSQIVRAKICMGGTEEYNGIGIRFPVNCSPTDVYVVA